MLCYKCEVDLTHVKGPFLEKARWTEQEVEMTCETCGRDFVIAFNPEFKVTQKPMYRA